MRKLELQGAFLWIKDPGPDPIFFPDPDPGDLKRPDPDETYTEHVWPDFIFG